MVNCAHRKSILGLATILASASVLWAVADVEENPYQSIIDRNPFRLRAIVASETVPTNALVALNLKFTGISMVKDVKKAYFMDSTKNPPEFYVLGEGEQQSALKVVRIDYKAGAADIINAGVPARVNFETHGLKTVTPGLAPTAAPVPSGIPGAVPGSPPGVAPRVPTPLPTVQPQTLPNQSFGTPAAAVTPGFAPNVPADNVRMIPTRS
ncbi:MAG TPA: hypothetical protein P5055_13465, partial [Candidatus Paceibacterota bacterium]|nr:hypothetical protein [Candidatus Paceibacterota bacterium]